MSTDLECRPLESIVINKSTVSAHEVYDAWRSSFSPLLMANPLNHGAAGVDTSVEAFALESSTIMYHRFDAQVFKRDRKLIAEYDNDCAAVCLWLEGKNFLDNGGSYTLSKKGSAFMIDMGKTVESTASPSTTLNMVIPKPLLRQFGMDTNKLAGMQLAADDPRFGILRSAFTTAFDHLAKAPRSQATAINRGLAGLLVGLMSGDEPAAEAQAPVRRAMLSSMVDYIENNIADPELGVETLLRVFPCSRSTLYRIFAAHGGVAQFIRERRLHRCYKVLLNKKYIRIPASTIAKSWGFMNNSHFGKVFKAHYKMTPCEVRDIAKSQSGQIEESDEAVYKDEQIDRLRSWFINFDKSDNLDFLDP